jgi:hypothetical protein
VDLPSHPHTFKRCLRGIKSRPHRAHITRQSHRIHAAPDKVTRFECNRGGFYSTVNRFNKRSAARGFNNTERVVFTCFQRFAPIPSTENLKTR